MCLWHRKRRKMNRAALIRRIATALALTLTLAVRMIHLMFLIWTSSKKRIQISVLSRLTWAHLPWSEIAQVIQMMMSLDLTCLGGWRHYTLLPMFPSRGRLQDWLSRSVDSASNWKGHWKGTVWKSLWRIPARSCNYTLSRSLPRTWLSSLPFIWPKKLPRCLDMFWIIPARCSMIRKLSLFSCLCFGSTAENCWTLLLDIDLANIWNCGVLQVG